MSFDSEQSKSQSQSFGALPQFQLRSRHGSDFQEMDSADFNTPGNRSKSSTMGMHNLQESDIDITMQETKNQIDYVIYKKRKHSNDKLDFLYKDMDTIKFQANQQSKVYFQYDQLQQFDIKKEEENDPKKKGIIFSEKKFLSQEAKKTIESNESYIKNSFKNSKVSGKFSNINNNNNDSSNENSDFDEDQFQKALEDQGNLMLQRQRLVKDKNDENLSQIQENDFEKTDKYFDDYSIKKSLKEEEVQSFVYSTEDYFQPVIESRTKYGFPTIIKKSKDFIIGGLNFINSSNVVKGSIVLYELQNKFQYFSEFLSNLPEVTALDISQDERILIVGFVTGEIIAYDFSLKEKVSKFKMHKAEVNKIQFVTDIDPKEFVSSDVQGNVYRNYVEIDNYYDKFMGNSDKIPFFSDSQELHYVLDFQLIPKHLPLLHFNKRFKIMAFSYKTHVDIYYLSQHSTEKIYKINKPKYIESYNNPSIAWGQGIFQLQKKSNVLLLITWGNFMYLVKLQIYDNEIAFHKTAYFKLPKEIIYANFIDESIILVIFAENINQIHLVHTTDFSFGFPTIQQELEHLEQNDELELRLQSINNNKGYFKTYEQQQHQELKLENQFQNLKNLQCAERLVIIKEGILYMVNYLSFIVGTMTSWKNLLIHDTLRCDWLSTMQKSLNIYNQHVKLLAGIKDDLEQRKEEMQHFICEKLSFTFLMFTIKNGEQKLSDNEIQEKLKILFQFCLKSETEQYLFTMLKDIMEESNLQALFYKTLQYFIKKKSCQKIPTNKINQICDYYVQHNQVKIVEELLLQIEFQDFDTTFLYQLCLDNKLYPALICISTVVKNDFSTPFSKMFGKYIENGKNDKKLGLYCQWYIKMCFQKQLITGQLMTVDQTYNMLKQIFSLLFVPFNLKIFFDLDLRIALDIIFMLFQQGMQDFIFDINTDLYKYVKIPQDAIKNAYYPLKSYKNNNSKTHYCIIQIVKSMEQEYIKQLEKENQKAKDQILIHFKIFEVRVLESGIFDFDPKKAAQILINFLELPNQFDYFYGIVNKKELDQQLIEYENLLLKNHIITTNRYTSQEILSKHSYYLGLVNEPEYDQQCKRNSFVILILSYYMDYFQDVDIEKILLLCRSLYLREAVCYIYNYQEQYEECFDSYLEMSDAKLKSKIFLWLDHFFNNGGHLSLEMQNKMTNKIICNVRSLMQVDDEKTLKLIRNYFNTNQIETEELIIKQLQGFPLDQLCFIEDILINYHPSKISDVRKVQFIELLCQFQPKRVLTEIQNREFPLDQVLDLTKKYNIKVAYAYMLTRTGAVKQALDVYIEIFIKYLNKCCDKIKKNNEFGERLHSNMTKIFGNKIDMGNKINKVKIMNKLKDVTDQCIKMYQYDSSYENIFFDIIDKLAKSMNIAELSDQVENTRQIKSLFEQGQIIKRSETSVEFMFQSDAKRSQYRKRQTEDNLQQINDENLEKQENESDNENQEFIDDSQCVQQQQEEEDNQNIELNDEFYEKFSESPEIQLKTELFSELIQVASKFIDVQQIITFVVQKNYGSAPLKLFQRTIQEFQDSYQFITGTCYYFKDINRDFYNKMSESHYHCIAKGQEFDGICSICQNFIIYNKYNQAQKTVVSFRCGHLYHTECLQTKFDFSKQNVKCYQCSIDQKVQLFKLVSIKNLQQSLKQNNGNVYMKPEAEIRPVQMPLNSYIKQQQQTSNKKQRDIISEYGSEVKYERHKHLNKMEKSDKFFKNRAINYQYKNKNKVQRRSNIDTFLF